MTYRKGYFLWFDLIMNTSRELSRFQGLRTSLGWGQSGEGWGGRASRGPVRPLGPEHPGHPQQGLGSPLQKHPELHFEVTFTSRFGWRLITPPHPPPEGVSVGEGRQEGLTKLAAVTPFLDASKEE